MLSIFTKEINIFFSSLIGYIVVGCFLVIMGLMLWVFTDSSILSFEYASLDRLFALAPIIFTFLIPAITMRSFAEENQTGTIELLTTRPLLDWEIVLGKFFACWALVFITLLPTLIYYYSVYQLGAPKGNLDSGAIMGSYIGLILLGGTFVSIGVFASSMTNNQIVAFILATFLCFFFYWGFFFLSKAPVFVGRVDDIVQMIGIDNHYNSISRGVVDTRDLVYFFSIMLFFIFSTVTMLGRRKW